MEVAGSGYAEQTLDAFSAALASAEPVPGGGSAAAVAAALAASLTAMVARLSLDRPRYAAYGATHTRSLEIAEASRRHLLALADADASAYAVFAAARRMPHGTQGESERRDAATQEAARGAISIPSQVVVECLSLIHAIDELAGRSNLNAASDLEVAALLLDAAARGAGANVLTNLPSLGDDRAAAALTSELEGRLHEIGATAAHVHRQVRSGGLLAPEAA